MSSDHRTRQAQALPVRVATLRGQHGNIGPDKRSARHTLQQPGRGRRATIAIGGVASASCAAARSRHGRDRRRSLSCFHGRIEELRGHDVAQRIGREAADIRATNASSCSTPSVVRHIAAEIPLHAIRPFRQVTDLGRAGHDFRFDLGTQNDVGDHRSVRLSPHGYNPASPR